MHFGHVCLVLERLLGSLLDYVVHSASLHRTQALHNMRKMTVQLLVTLFTLQNKTALPCQGCGAAAAVDSLSLSCVLPKLLCPCSSLHAVSNCAQHCAAISTPAPMVFVGFMYVNQSFFGAACYIQLEGCGCMPLKQASQCPHSTY